jgi:hypothetical protein
MAKLRPLPVTLINIFEVILAIGIGFLLRRLVNLLVPLFSIGIEPVWITVILGIPLMLILIKAHYVFHGWLVKNGLLTH